MKHIKYSELTEKFYYPAKDGKVDITDDIKEIVSFLQVKNIDWNAAYKCYIK